MANASTPGQDSRWICRSVSLPKRNESYLHRTPNASAAFHDAGYKAVHRAIHLQAPIYYSVEPCVQAQY